MALEDSQRKEVEALFSLYRENYEKLKVLQQKIGINPSNISTVVKVNDEEMHSWILISQPFDFAIHTCGNVTFPKGLVENNYFLNLGTIWEKLSPEQIELIKDSYKSLKFNFIIFEDAVQHAKGLWPEVIARASLRSVSEDIPQLGGGIGDVLSSNYQEVLESVSSNKIMKKIEGHGPKERKAAISDSFLSLFIKENYVCVHFEETICVLCGSSFLPQSQYMWAGLVPPVYCGICLEMCVASTDFFRRFNFSGDQRKDNYIFGIQTFADYFGFIPSVSSQKRVVLSQLFQSGIDAEELNFAMKVSSLLPWKDSVKLLFGSWAHLLESSGLLSHRQRGRGGHQSIASDGHHCLSLGERAICEFLSKNDITHDREPKYPHHEVFNPNGLLRGDFLIDGMIIEFAGMMSNREYAERMAVKQELAKVSKIRWMKLEASSLNDLSEMLKKIKETSDSLDSQAELSKVKDAE